MSLVLCAHKVIKQDFKTTFCESLISENNIRYWELEESNSFFHSNIYLNNKEKGVHYNQMYI